MHTQIVEDSYVSRFSFAYKNICENKRLFAYDVWNMLETPTLTTFWRLVFAYADVLQCIDCLFASLLSHIVPISIRIHDLLRSQTFFLYEAHMQWIRVQLLK